MATDGRPLPDEPMAIDLLNTELVVDGVLVDLLADREGVARWLGRHGFATRPGPRVQAHLVEAREAIRAVLERRAGGRIRLNAVLDRARVHVQLDDDGPVRTIEVDEPSWLPGVTAANALVELLAEHGDRIRRCGHPDCVLWFLDTSKNGTRRWHSMATCGNRLKAQRHAEKQRAGDR